MPAKGLLLLAYADNLWVFMELSLVDDSFQP
jgi:hypothetical protein